LLGALATAAQPLPIGRAAQLANVDHRHAARLVDDLGEAGLILESRGGAARMIDAVNRIGHAHAPYACATVGFVQVSPNSRNTIPGRVFFTVDFRHPKTRC